MKINCLLDTDQRSNLKILQLEVFSTLYLEVGNWQTEFWERSTMHIPKTMHEFYFQNRQQCGHMRILPSSSPGLNIQVEKLESCWYKVTFIFRNNSLFGALKTWLWWQMHPYLMLIKTYKCFHFPNAWWRFSGSSTVLLSYGTQPEACWTTGAALG